VNLLALGKDPWFFKDLDDQLNMYHHQWQADQQKQIIAKMAGKIPGKSNDGKRKIMNEILITTMVVAAAATRAIMTEEDAEDAEEAEEVAAEEAIAIPIILKQLNTPIVENNFTIRPTAPHKERMTLRFQTWYPKRISKI
jgi:hypothetical protein